MHTSFAPAGGGGNSKQLNIQTCCTFNMLMLGCKALFMSGLKKNKTEKSQYLYPKIATLLFCSIPVRFKYRSWMSAVSSRLFIKLGHELCKRSAWWEWCHCVAWGQSLREKCLLQSDRALCNHGDRAALSGPAALMSRDVIFLYGCCETLQLSACCLIPAWIWFKHCHTKYGFSKTHLVTHNLWPLLLFYFENPP